VGEAISIIWKICVLAEFVLAGRLLLQGLAGQYPALMTVCSVLPLKSLLLMYVYSHVTPGRTDPGRIITENLAPVEWILHAWLVYELFSRWTRSYKGIGRFGKILLVALLAASILVSAAIWQPEWKALDFARNFRIYYILNRVIFGALALFVVGMWWFFRRHPVAIARNIIRHTQVSILYFAGAAIGFLSFTMIGLKAVPMVNLGLLLVTTVSFCAWAALLSRAGQIVPAAQRVSAEDRQRIERINEELLGLMGELTHRR
jgi:hypothetical protein